MNYANRQQTADPFSSRPSLHTLCFSRSFIDGSLFSDPLNNTSSPYRGKNYKLLLDMITNAAVRAYRSELRISGDRYTLNWLEKFMHRNDMEDGPNLKVRLKRDVFELFLSSSSSSMLVVIVVRSGGIVAGLLCG